MSTNENTVSENNEQDLVNEPQINEIETNSDFQYQELQNKINDLEAQLKRSMADYQNLLRRSQQEREQMHKYAVEPALMALIPCLDNFYFALKSFNEKSSSAQLLESLKMLWTSMMGSLSQIGVKTIDSTNIPYDPALQEAVNQIPSEEHPEGTVLEVFRVGYSLNDKVIRPSQVSVSVARPNTNESGG